MTFLVWIHLEYVAVANEEYSFLDFTMLRFLLPAILVRPLIFVPNLMLLLPVSIAEAWLEIPII